MWLVDCMRTNNWQNANLKLRRPIEAIGLENWKKTAESKIAFNQYEMVMRYEEHH